MRTECDLKSSVRVLLLVLEQVNSRGVGLRG